MKKALVNIALCVIVLALLGLMVAFFVYFDAKAVLLWYSEHLNYYTITLLMTIESSFIPFPSEIVVPPAAYFAHQNPDLDFVLICFFATLGAAIGAVINYVLAILIGRPLLYRFADTKFAHICLIDKDKVAVAEEYFNRHGAISTFIGRLIPDFNPRRTGENALRQIPALHLARRRTVERSAHRTWLLVGQIRAGIATL